MRWLTRLRLRARSLVSSARVGQELDDELRYHLDREIEEQLAAGLTLDEARRAARHSMGLSGVSVEECRDMQGISVIDHRVQDLRFAVRQLRKHPAFALTVIVVFALGLASSVAMFGFVDAALIKPLPYHDPTRLVTLFGARPDLAPAQTRGGASYLNFVDWRERSRAFTTMAAYDVREGFTLTTATGSERVSGLRVTSGFFKTLGVVPILGREFDRSEEGLAAPATVMLSHNAWQTRFDGRADIVGQTIMLQGQPHLVIGVLPRGFHFTMASQADFWATIRGPQPCWEIRGCQSLQAVARLADGMSLEAARAGFDVVLQDLRAQYSVRDPVTAKLVPLRDVMSGNVRPLLLMLLSGAALLLAIAAIIVVSLLLARTDSRVREIAVRDALGASSRRLMQQFATEALVLVAAGCALGLTFAAWGIRALQGLLTTDLINRLPYLMDVGMNLRLMTFACAVSAIIAVALAAVPMLRVSLYGRPDALRDGGRGSAGTTWSRFGAPLVVAQLAIATILLTSAALISGSLYRLVHTDTGFDAEPLMTASVTLAGRANSADPIAQPGVLARAVADRVAVLPGVQAAGYADLLPVALSFAPASTFWIVGRADDRQIRDNWPVRRVSAGYFDALGVRLIRGRTLSEDDVAAQRLVIVINETAARRFFPDDEPIGKQIAFGDADSPHREIIGVVTDIQDGPLETPPHPAGYVPFDQIGFGLIVRQANPEAAMAVSLASAIREVHKDVLVNVGRLRERIEQTPTATTHRSAAWLAVGFALTALVLSVVGLYGVVAYSVAQRTREIGVRMALGAQRRSVYRLVMGQAAWLVGAGTVLGTICAIGAAMMLRQMFFDVRPWSPTTSGIAAVILAASAFVATYLPARRAASTNPLDVLRAD